MFFGTNWTNKTFIWTGPLGGILNTFFKDYKRVNPKINAVNNVWVMIIVEMFSFLLKIIANVPI